MSVVDTICERVSYDLINTKDICIDENGQRDVERRRAQFNKIMKNFDPLVVNPLKVALIDGKYFCFDGQMTLKVLKARNKGKDLQVPCLIYTGMTKLEAAEKFTVQGGIESPVKIGDVLRVRAAYGDPDAIGFMRATESAGVDISWNSIRSRDSITAIATAYDSYLRFKEKKQYTEMLRALKDAWSGFPEAFDARIIKGATELVSSYPEIDFDRLSRKLNMTRPSDVIRDAQIDRASGARKYAVIMLQHYNKGARENQRLANKL